jgi:hypothetical protein
MIKGLFVTKGSTSGRERLRLLRTWGAPGEMTGRSCPAEKFEFGNSSAPQEKHIFLILHDKPTILKWAFGKLSTLQLKYRTSFGTDTSVRPA